MNQGHALAGGGQVTPLAQDIAVAEEALDDGGTGCRGAEAALAHRLAEFLILDKLAGSFHRAQECRFVEAGGWTCLGLVNLDGISAGWLELRRGAGHWDERLGILLASFPLGLLAIDSLPTGIGQHLPFALEGFTVHAGDAGRDIEAGRRIKDRDETLGDHLEKLGLDLVEPGGGGAGRDDGVVVGDLGIVEDLAGLDDHVLLQGALSVLSQFLVLEGLECGFYSGEVVLGKVAGISTGIGEHLVVLVETLGELQGALGAKAEAAVRLALQGGQVIEERGGLCGRLLDLLDDAGLPGALGADFLGAGLVPNALRFLVGAILFLRLLEAFVKPTSGIASRGDGEFGMDLEVGLRLEGTDLLLALDKDR